MPEASLTSNKRAAAPQYTSFPLMAKWTNATGYRISRSILDEVLRDETDPVIKGGMRYHGCWCGRFNPLVDQRIYAGGTVIVDLLDQLCKEWIVARYQLHKVQKCCYNCNRLTQFYSATFESGNKFKCHPDNTGCNKMTCETDVYYASRIKRYLELNRYHRGVFKMAEEGNCHVYQGRGDLNSGYVSFPVRITAMQGAELKSKTAGNLLDIIFRKYPKLSKALKSHGCWCARLNDQLDQTLYEDATIVADELDSLCKQWLSARFCNKNPGGTCHNYAAINDPYHIDIEGFDDWTCKDTENCPLDNCIIDIEYGRRIYDLIVDNSHRLSNIFKTADLGDCTPNGPAVATGPRQCTGTVPDIYMVSQDSSPEPVTPWSEA